MTNDPKAQLAALRREVDANAPISPEPVFADAAAQGRKAAAQVRDAVAEHADQLAETVRAKPLTAVLATFFGAYLIGRIGRFL